MSSAYIFHWYKESTVEEKKSEGADEVDLRPQQDNTNMLFRDH